MTSLLRPPENCWRVERADAFSVIVDADDYFAAAREAMMKAERSILLIGWDFDARTVFGHPDVDDGAPRKIGNFILWLARRNRDLQIRLLLWNPGAVTSIFKGSTLLYLLRWKWHRQITVRLDNRHPVGGSHHQKILVIDDRIAFCGGIDVTLDRWDTRDHRDADPHRVRPNGTPYGPWHDASAMCTGDAARALGDLGRLRWKSAGGEVLEPVSVPDQGLPKEQGFSFGPATIGIARSSPRYNGNEPVLEIEQLYIDMIMAAKRMIYAESQYFASRRVAQALARRLSEPDPPEIVLINPIEADNWLGSLAMDTARARLHESLRRHDPQKRFRIYHPVTAAGQMIYVHSKLMIVDDRLLRVGSSNLNNRSMRFDNECDLALDAADDPTGTIGARIADFRNDLLAEHLGVSPEQVAEVLGDTGSLIETVERLRRPAPTGEHSTLVPYQVPENSGLAEWLADNEILDPDGPEEVFEPIEKRGLFRGRLKMPFRRNKG